MIVAMLLLVASGESTAAKPFKLEGGAHQVTYSYEWPTEAAAIPALDRILREQMEEDRSQILALAREMQGDRWFEMGVGYQTTLGYEVSGKSDALLSLSGGHWQFTGGAHGNGVTIGLLWDRKKEREIKVDELFERPTEYALLMPRFCEELNRQRAENREGLTFEDLSVDLREMYFGCPRFSQITVVPVDENANGKFDRFYLTADQYVAGPYSEGPYIINLHLTERLIAAMKPEYRPSFEVHPQ